MNRDLISIIPVAGLGIRMMPTTKVIPKELLPIPVEYKGRMVLIPLLHLILLKLYQAGIRDYVIVLSRNKEIIKNYLTIDYSFIEFLRKSENKEFEAHIFENFYKVLSNINITFKYQDIPRGFGDAIYQAKEYIRNDFIIHPGDDFIIDDERDKNYIEKLIAIKKKFNSDLVFYVEEVVDPRHYGVIIGREIERNIYRVDNLIEKPTTPTSNLAITAIYVMTKDLLDEMNYLRNMGVEWELIDAINRLLKKGYTAYAIKINESCRIDVGRPIEYIKSIEKALERKIRI
ncbi:MAG TPA: hypothetical protein EYH44_01545 [Thermoprotei archaeon]|nr:hypothetical protein [Thermoprotei archaeon]